MSSPSLIVDTTCPIWEVGSGGGETGAGGDDVEEVGADGESGANEECGAGEVGSGDEECGHGAGEDGGGRVAGFEWKFWMWKWRFVAQVKHLEQ